MPSYEKQIKLPSRGLLYNGSLPDGELTIKPWTTQEEKLLTSSQSGTGTIDTLFKRSASFPEGLQPSQLITYDRLSLLIHMRVQSYGAHYQCAYNCANCGKLNVENVDLEKDVLAEETQLEDGASNFTLVELPISEHTIAWRYATGEDENALDKQRAKIRQGDGALLEYRIARQIVEIDGNPAEYMDALSMVRKLPSGDNVTIRDSMRDKAFGVETVDFYYTCKSCGAEQMPSKLPMGQDFFRLVSPRTREI